MLAMESLTSWSHAAGDLVEQTSSTSNPYALASIDDTDSVPVGTDSVSTMR